MRSQHAETAFHRALWLVIAINAAMFLIEMAADIKAGSQALQADSLDFLGDTLTYGISLLVTGGCLQMRASAALAKGVSLAVMGAWVLGSTLYQTFALQRPDEMAMGAIGTQRRHRQCFRAGGSAWHVGAATGWPDITVVSIWATLFFNSSAQIVRQAFERIK